MNWGNEGQTGHTFTAEWPGVVEVIDSTQSQLSELENRNHGTHSQLNELEAMEVTGGTHSQLIHSFSELNN